MPDQSLEPMSSSIPRKIFFAWAVIWASLMTVVSAIGSITHQWISGDINVFRRWSIFWGRSMFAGMGVRVQPIIRADLDDRAYIFVANHQVALDIPAAGLAIPRPFGWVAKAELARTPFLGSAIKASPSVFIDRSHPKKSLASIKEAGKRIRKGLSVIIFPEGRRTYGPRLAPFKKGAFLLAVEAGVPIVPVTIIDAYRVLDERRKLARPGTIHIVVGEPIPMEGVTRRDTNDVMASVASVMQSEIDGWNRPEQVQ